MKQILQNISNGKTEIADVPCPKLIIGSLLVATRNTLVSSGTERMLIDFGRANLFDKARQQPDKVKTVLEKVRTDGLLPTIDAVRSKLDQPLPLGYCNAGVVLESGVDGFSAGDRVVSNGNHAEVVRVPKNLCAKIPAEVDYETAAFTVLGAVGLQGVRLIKPTLGETVVVSGLGLIGLMTVQLLRANGCRVLGIDVDSFRCKMAHQFGAETVDLSKGEDPISVAQAYSRGRGVDAVVVAASTDSDEVMHQAAEMCRKRGRIVLVGVVGLSLRREDYFKKEITIQVSASYGPGRYDVDYEDKGQDYPVGFVRWTEQRNFEAVLDLMASGTLNVKPLISHRFSIEDAAEAYGLLNDTSALGVLLEYPNKDEDALRKSVISLSNPNSSHITNKESNIGAIPVVGFIGAGNYSSRTLIPAFKKAGASMDTLVSIGGISSVYHGKKAGFKTATTDLDTLWDNCDINTVAVVTRHNEHAAQVSRAIKAGKHVFVEKPLAVTHKQLSMIIKMINGLEHTPLLMIGFNRRFAPHIVRMKSLIEVKRESKVVVMTINAGSIPADHWTQDHEIGGGRIVGEACHFIDLMRFLVGHPITGHQAMKIGSATGIDVLDDKVSINLSFEDGSFGTIHYLANGGKSFPKERVEVFCEEAVLQMDNYRILRGYDWPGFKKMKLMKQDKGQIACTKAFVEAIKSGKPSPIPFEEIIEISRVSIEVADSLRLR